ncbi:maleylpyruvate isomerase family mycothiol-dependent enzyme [Pseudarthrobacter sp. J75]|uniref:maleylpyruvate isomerase family mycothiol-dependent enzyme n=1 Tax=unclassified Pseudarthrobacter TaxID=2647000 RepID=UPI002E81ADED|nr:MULTISPECIES: maleylpyruvate isomerase family mycothiol-dependent enzyme [unclassified Pseudarthrobacter]MEE2521877.1 maleylpyruvate isomerase family mycothiol-dependent enzyme [Pseudarthrobacter sp. J47]MEE2527954.1 maleylpyruvate isomerase family mycothiol-dependent enzyme [Pseudarthrobacter sp. J75]
MTSPAPDALLAELHKAAGIAADTAASFTDQDIAAPSTLPGWTRGHVLAHLAGISNAMARQLEFAARDQAIELYDGGFEGRTKAIDMAAGHSAAQHQADLQEALRRALHNFDSLPDVKDSAAYRTGWYAPISYRNGVVLDGGLALWRELVIHTSDLGTGRGPETWSRQFCEHLFDFLAARIRPEDRVVLQPLGLQPVTIGDGGRTTVVNGMLTDIAAWLAGREPSLGSLRAQAAADGVDLPELLPWPAGVQAAK